MKKFLLLVLLIGLPGPLFAEEKNSTSGYKKMESCKWRDKQKISLWKKEHTKSKKWGTYVCDLKPGIFNKYMCTNNQWIIKGEPYDKAYNVYTYGCKEGLRTR